MSTTSLDVKKVPVSDRGINATRHIVASESIDLILTKLPRGEVVERFADYLELRQRERGHGAEFGISARISGKESGHIYEGGRMRETFQEALSGSLPAYSTTMHPKIPTVEFDHTNPALSFTLSVGPGAYLFNPDRAQTFIPTEEGEIAISYRFGKNKGKVTSINSGNSTRLPFPHEVEFLNSFRDS